MAQPPPPPPLTAADVPSLSAALAAALDPRTRPDAEAALAGLAGRGGYCACLLTIASDPSADPSTRYLAAITLKNTVTRGWRGRGPTAVPADDRPALRGALVPALLAAADPRLARQLALAIARVARVDWPAAWPGLVPSLAVPENEQALTGLAAVLKELASKRLAADAAAFARLADDLLPGLWGAWAEGASAALAGAGAGAGDAAALRRARAGLKCVRRLLVGGRPPDARTYELWAPVAGAVGPLVAAARAAAAARARAATRGDVDALAVKLLTTVRELAEEHPWSVLSADGGAGAVAAGEAAAAGADAARTGAPSPVDDRLATQALLLCKALLDAVASADPDDPGPPAGPRATAAAAARAAAAPARAALLAGPLAPARRAALANTLMRRYLRLTPADVDEWDADPESFAHAAATATASAWRDTPRGAADALLAALVAHDRAGMGPSLAAALTETSAALAAAAAAGDARAAADAALDAEAAAGAATAAAYDLHDAVDWDGWLARDLVPWLGGRVGGGPPHGAPPPPLPPRAAAALARRAALAVAAWTPRASRADRAALYAALPPALGSADAAVALAATAALTALVDDWGFHDADFMPHAPAAVAGVASSLARATDADSQAAHFALLNALVDRLPPDAAAAGAVGPLLASIPRLWDGAGGGAAPLLRSAVAAALARVANALGAASPAAHATLVPVMRAALDATSPDAALLLEDGVALWAIALRNAPTRDAAAAAPLLAAAPAAAAALAASTEHVGGVAAGAAAAALLGGEGWLASADAAPLAAALAAALPAVNERGALAILTASDAVFAAAPSAGGAAWLDGVLVAAAADALSGRAAAPPLAAATASLLARLALVSPAAFMSVAARAAGGGGGDGAAAALALVDGLAAAFDAAPSGGRRLIALALAALLPAPLPGLLDRLPSIAAAVTGAWAERDAPTADPDPPPLRFALDRGDAFALDGPAGDDGPLAASADAEPEADRRAAVRRTGPASERLAPRVAAAVAAAATAHGDAFARAAGGLDPRVSREMNAVVAEGGGG